MDVMNDKPETTAVQPPEAASMQMSQGPSAPKPPAKGIQVTDRAIARIKSAMAKEGIDLKSVSWAATEGH